MEASKASCEGDECDGGASDVTRDDAAVTETQSMDKLGDMEQRLERLQTLYASAKKDKIADRVPGLLAMGDAIERLKQDMHQVRLASQRHRTEWKEMTQQLTTLALQTEQ